MRLIWNATLAFGMWALLSQAGLAASLSFVPGHYYGTYDLFGGGASLRQFDATGQILIDQGVRGPTDFGKLAFGPDGNLYVVGYYQDGNYITQSILSLNARLETVQRYVLPPDLRRRSDILFDQAGHFYWGNAQFDIGDPNSARPFLPHDVFLEAILPNGHYLTIKDDALLELNSELGVLREVFRPQSNSFDWLENIAYDPISGALFASGRSGGKAHIWRLDLATGDVIASTSFQASDLFWTREGYLLASSYGQIRLYTPDLASFVVLASSSDNAITQFVPEPACSLLAVFALIGFGVISIRRRMRLQAV